MDYWEALYKAAKKSGTPTTKIGPKVGLTRGFIASCKTQDVEPKIYNAVKYLDACGYVLAAIPADKVPDYAIVITERDGRQESQEEECHD